MNSNEFVKAIKLQTSDAATKAVPEKLANPPGSRPSAKLLELSRWYNNLGEHDRRMVVEAMRQCAEQSIFSFLCVLDGVKVFEDGPNKGELELYYVNQNDRVLLNGPRGEELHNIYQLMLDVA